MLVVGRDIRCVVDVRAVFVCGGGGRERVHLAPPTLR